MDIENSVEEAIERLEYIDRTYSCNNYYSRWDLKCIEIILSDYKRVLKENEHKTERIENQKAELAILNEKQKELNKLQNTLSSYRGQFRRQEKEIKKLKSKLDEIDKINFPIIN